MKKQKTKKKLIYRILKVIWITVGIFIALITGLLYIRLYSARGFGVIGLAMLFAAGIYILFIYIVITILYYLIKWIIKLIKKARKIK